MFVAAGLIDYKSVFVLSYKSPVLFTSSEYITRKLLANDSG